MRMPDIVLQTYRLTKKYGAVTAVEDLSLQVCAGEVFGLLGPNGAGKTTSIFMMCGLLKPDAGEVRIHGKRIRDAGTRTRVGVCPQSIVLWNTLTCMEQLEFIGAMYDMPSRLARERGGMLLEAMGLGEKRNKLARTLSGGMQRRLNLIMALVHDPEILVLDEPEAGLDPQSRVLVREFVKSLARQKTILLTTHNMDEAERMADRVAIIDHGKLLVSDTPDALKRTMGEGDVLELEVKDAAYATAQAVVARFVPNVRAEDQKLLVRARGIVDTLPAILHALREAGVPLGEVRLRANTLEDVFLQLTGRRLRE
jgi:ABC-2 type transport system ATP-binding protein